MLHCAAQEGHAEVVPLLINDYKLKPAARSKVCGQTCRCHVKSSRASGGCAIHVESVHVVEMCVKKCRLRVRLRYTSSSSYVLQAC